MRTGRLKILVTGAITALLLGALAAAAVAATPTAPKLTITVSPARVHPAEAYKIVITVSYDKKSLHTTPYVVAFLQYTGNACKPTAKAEKALPTNTRTLDFAGTVKSTSFSRTDHWTAGGIKGSRRACAYMYPVEVSPNSSTKPLLTANAPFLNA